VENITKIGVVGCGFVSSLYMSTLHEYPSLKLVGAFDINPTRLKKFCAFYETKEFSVIEELIDQCDLVVNLTTPESHFDISKKVLECGKPVYTEKPLTLNQSDDNYLVDLAIEKGINIHGAPCVHHGKMAETVKHYLDQELLGEIYAVYAEMDNDQVHAKAYENWRNDFGVNWPAKNEFESGATVEHAAYSLALLEKWFGSGKLESVYQNECITDKVIPIHKRTADFSCALIKYPNNIVARLTCSIVAPRDHSIRIIGERGVLTVDDIWFFDTPVYWQNFFTLRSKTRLNPIKRKLKPISDGFPLGRKTDSARMDFCRGVYELSLADSSNEQFMHSLLNVNDIVLNMNGNSIVEKQCSWQILGSGAMAKRYHEALDRNGYPLLGIYSSKADRARKVAKELGVDLSYDDIKLIPRSEERATAYIASNNTDHYAQVKEMLEKGYNVLCEKPLTLCPVMTEELYQLAEKRNLRLQENLWSLFLPSAKAIKSDCDSSEYLELYFCSPIAYSPDKRQWQKDQGGCLYDLGIYCLAWAVYLFGEVEKFTIIDIKREYSIVSEMSFSVVHLNQKESKIKAGFHTKEQYIKVGRNYFYPIFSPEYSSKINTSLSWKLRRKFTKKDYPARDPYAYILDSMNKSDLDRLENPHSPAASIHIARLMKNIETASQAFSQQ